VSGYIFKCQRCTVTRSIRVGGVCLVSSQSKAGGKVRKSRVGWTARLTSTANETDFAVPMDVGAILSTSWGFITAINGVLARLEQAREHSRALRVSRSSGSR
jgi:hypothetical protein